MKRFILLIMLLLPVMGMAQQNDIASIVKKYSSRHGYTTIEMSKYMLESMGVKANIDSISVIATEEAKYIEELQRDMDGYTSALSTILSVVDDGTRVQIYGCSDAEGIKELVVLTVEDSEMAVIYVSGKNIGLSNIESLMDLVN